MASVLGYARTFFVGGVFRAEPLPSFESEIERFHEIIADLAAHLASGTPIREISYEQLLQGPFSDAMTHAGQIALLRRQAGAPVPSENFLFAQISPERLGSRQPGAAAPTPVWLGKVVHWAWKLARWQNRFRAGKSSRGQP
jgi:hemin uptake protein HemP